jgi:hypothetical protein
MACLCYHEGRRGASSSATLVLRRVLRAPLAGPAGAAAAKRGLQPRRERWEVVRGRGNDEGRIALVRVTSFGWIRFRRRGLVGHPDGPRWRGRAVTSARCGRSWEADPRREGRLGPRDVESFDRHCRVCAACAADLARDERLRALGRSLPAAEPGQLALRRLRARIMRDVMVGVSSRPSSPWRVAVASSLGIALVAVAGLVGVRVAARSHGDAARASTARASAPMEGTLGPAAGAVWTPPRAVNGSPDVQIRSTLIGGGDAGAASH